MNRRTFVLLSGSASGALLHPPIRLSAHATLTDGRLRFQLDDQHRWSLWYHGDRQPVPVLRDATLGAWIGDRFLALGDLEGIVSGTLRPPGGEALVVRGRAAGVYLEAQFFSAEAGSASLATVTVSLYPDRTLPSVRGVRFFQRAESDVLPGAGPLLAHVNGYHSWNANRLARVASGLAETASHGALGLMREGGGALAVSFDAGEPGEARVILSAAELDAVSDWLPARPLRAEGDASTMRLCYLPVGTGDGLDALRTLFQPSSPVDRDRFAAAAAPAGWCSWYELFGDVTEADMIANLDFCAAHFDRRHFRLIQLDDGYQKATGDWETNAKFPHGHRWLTDRIHVKGFQAGLWVAPFAVTDRSGVPAAHRDWLLRDAATGGGEPIVWDTRDDWGGRVYSIDGAHPDVQEWLYQLAHRVVRTWGYDYLKIDFLDWATKGWAHYGGRTHAEAYRLGLAAIRDGLGSGAFLLGCGAPLQHAVGYVDGMRIGTDVDATWSGIQGPARAAALRSFYHRAVWLNDPDCLVVRPPLAEHEAQAWAAIVAVSGGLALFSDDLPKLPPARVPLLQRTIPVAPIAGRPVRTAVEEPEVAPAILAGTTVVRLATGWRFRAGDDPGYAAPAMDDSAWDAVAIPHRLPANVDGYFWYRVRFTLPPSRGDGRPERRNAILELGKIDDTDETFINGVKLGQTGEFPPAYRGAWNEFRRYAVPGDALRWGGGGDDNVLAIRGYDGGGPGGLWSVRRDRPPAVWVAEGAPRWWTVVLVNWDDEPRDVAVPLASLGLAGVRFSAYDVWRDAPRPDVTSRVTATIAPRSALTLALRASLARPQVIGTTRHVVQGAVDVADETWHAAARTLSARAVNLDTRPYRVTIAVPRGMRAGECRADRPCTVSRLASGHAVLTWDADPEGRNIGWELKFRGA